MDQHQFIEGPLPPNISYSFTETLFNRESHRTLQQESGWVSFYALKGHEVIASIHFHIADAVARSPLRAPYGSIEGRDDLSEDVIDDFFQFIETRLRMKHVQSVTIKLHPADYFSSLSSVTLKKLLGREYKIISDEPQSIIPVRPIDFRQIINRSEQKRLRKCTDARFQFGRSEKLTDVYQVISRWREMKGFDISMSLHDLIRSVTRFPESYIGFIVANDSQIIAASICIVVSDNILYDYAHDHDPTFDSFSPIVHLVAGIYDYCQHHRISMLDLGTSLSAERMKESLVKFKERLGAHICRKIVVQKTYD